MCVLLHVVINTLFHFQLQRWESLDNDKPVLSVYSRITGQEWFFADMSKETLRNIITVRNRADP